MGSLLFSPSGRVDHRSFLIGASILAALLFVIKASGTVSLSLAGILGILGLGLIYCWFAVFIKRFHDAGKSGWLAIIPVAAIVLIGMFFIDPTVQRTVAPELMQEMEQAMLTAIQAEGLGAVVSVSQEYAEPGAKATGVQVGAARFIFSMIVALLTSSLLKSDPNANRFGPAAGDADTFS